MIADLSAEASVVCALLLTAGEAGSVSLARRILPDPAMFTDARLRAMYQVIGDLSDEGAIVDPPALTRRLATHHAGLGVDADFIGEVIDATPSAANLEHHAKTVRDRWQRRQVVEQARAATMLAEDLTVPVNGTIASVVDRLTQTHQGTSRGALPPRTVLADVMEELDRAASLGTHVMGIGSSLPELDRMTAGWQGGELWIVGARPSTGKTSFTVDCALAAADVGPVLFCSAEMPQRAIYRRMVARVAETNLREVGSPASWSLALKRVNAAAEFLSAAPIRVEDDRLTPADVRLAVNEYAAELGRTPALVVVDYLGKLSAGRRAENRNIEVGYISAGLARIAVDLNVPILCAHQLSRASVKDGKPRRPNQSDLRDSGSIEQDADGVLLLHTPFQQPEQRPGLHTFHTEIIVEKNRNGETGLLHTWHDRSTGHWSEMSFHDVRAMAA